MSESEKGVGTFAERFARLIATVHPADREPYSYREIADGIAHLDGAMSHEFLRQLVAGRQPHPRCHQMRALATFFGVPVTYFFDGEVAASVDVEIAQLPRWRDEEAAELAERITELPPEHRNAVSDLVEHLATYVDESRGPRTRRGGQSARG